MRETACVEMQPRVMFITPTHTRKLATENNKRMSIRKRNLSKQEKQITAQSEMPKKQKQCAVGARRSYLSDRDSIKLSKGERAIKTTKGQTFVAHIATNKILKLRKG